MKETSCVATLTESNISAPCQSAQYKRSELRPGHTRRCSTVRRLARTGSPMRPTPFCSGSSSAVAERVSKQAKKPEESCSTRRGVRVLTQKTDSSVSVSASLFFCWTGLPSVPLYPVGSLMSTCSTPNDLPVRSSFTDSEANQAREKTGRFWGANSRSREFIGLSNPK